jgi:hypothetical protein
LLSRNINNFDTFDDPLWQDRLGFRRDFYDLPD